MNIYPLTIYYDGNCPLCLFEVDMLRQRNTDDALRFVNIHDATFDPASLGTTFESLDARIHARRADGVLVEGPDVFALAYRAVGFEHLAALISWAPLRPATRWIYAGFARHRHGLGRLLGPFFERHARRERARQSLLCTDRCQVRTPTTKGPQP